MKLSQKELAARVGSKQPPIAWMESELVDQVSMDFLLNVSFVLGVPCSIGYKTAAA